MHPSEQRQFRNGFWATALGTLVSRMLGMLRDATTANLLGLAAGGVMDAFVLAFRLANLARRLLGEGALATSYLPVLTAELERDRGAALRLAATVLAILAALLALVVLAGEAICGVVWIRSGPGDTRLLAGLTAALLPYLLFICLAAHLSATLHALGKFRLPALASTLLNIGWLIGAWWAAPHLAHSATGRAYVLAGAIVIAGALQAGIQWAALGRLGLEPIREPTRRGGQSHFAPRAPQNRDSPRRLSDRPLPRGAVKKNFAASGNRPALGRVLRPMGPIALALSVTQLNTLIDSAVAWLLTRPLDGPAAIAWLPGGLAYPLRAGATAALYYAERFYQLPVGLLGVAAATVIFPLLSRHAARQDQSALGRDLTSGLRLVVCLSLPATMGLILVAEPLTRLVLGHGLFGAEDVIRTVATTRAYAAGIVAYCALPLVLRGFYAAGDARRPLFAALAALATNAVLDLALAWPLGEAGLALATAISSVLQLLLLGASFSRVHAPLDWRRLGVGAMQSTLATATLAAAVLLAGQGAAAIGIDSIAGRLVLAMLAGGLAFLAALWALRSDDLAIVWPARSRPAASQPAAARRSGQVTNLAP